MVGKLASIVLYVVMARKLGEADFGVFTFAFALVTLATTVANLGQDTIMTREVARDRRRIRHYFGDALTTKLAIAAPALAVAFGIVALFGGDGQTTAVTGVLAAGVLLDLATSSCFAVFQALERFAAVAAALITQRVLTAVLGVAALAAGASVAAVAVMFVAGSLAALVVAAALLRRYLGRDDLEVAPSRWATLVRTALPLGLTGVFATVLFRIDVALLAALDSDEAVGEYGAAYRLFEATLFVSWSLGAATYPVFSRLSRSSEPPVGQVFQGALKLILAATLPLAAAGVMFGDRLAVLAYGESFGEAGDALRILAPTVAFFGISYIAGYLIVAQDRQNVWTVVYGSVAVLNIAANLLLIPAFSLHGAAAVTAGSEVVVAAALGAVAIRTVGGIAWTRTLLGPILATATAVAVGLALGAALITALIAAGIAYVAALLAFERLVFPDDARILLDLVRRRPGVAAAASEQAPPVG